MNKHDLITEIQGRATAYHPSHLSRDAIAAVLDSLGDVSFGAISSGESVTLPGIGKLKPSVRKARQGRNPATGETIQLPESFGVRFSLGKQFKDSLNP